MENENLMENELKRKKAKMLSNFYSKFAAMWPPRYDAEVEKDLPEVSQFNIFFKNEVKTIFHTISEALVFQNFY